MRVPEISIEQLQELQASGKPFLLLDVREEWECKKYGSLPGSKRLSLQELPRALRMTPTEFKVTYGFELNRQTRIIFYCRSGSRSARATALAIGEGYHAENFAGSVLAWSRIDNSVQAY